MATNFPGSLDSYSDRSDGQVIEPEHVNDLQDAVEALERRTLGMPLVWFTATGATRTSRNFARKGVIYTPSANQSLLGLRVFINTPGASTTMKGAVITVTGGLVATITETAQYVNGATSGAVIVDVLFASPVSLTSGTAYGLVFGYDTSGGSVTGTTDFPLFITPRAPWQSMVPRAGTVSADVYHIATLTPTVGTSVTTGTNDQASGASTYNIAPIFDWA